jgi:PPOX class probable F420-dependent enzyme
MIFAMDLDQARTFIRDNPRSVLATRRQNGSPQMTPIVAALDAEGRVMISSRETAYKTRNARRDPRVSVMFQTNQFFGGHVQVDGTAEVISLPEAMDLLVDYYKRLSGEHPDWDEYRTAMEAEKRVIIRVTIDRAGPNRSG